MNSDEWERIHALQASGETIKGISRRTGFSRNTIRRALQRTTAPDDRRGARSTLSDSHSDDIKALRASDTEITVQAISSALGWPHAPPPLAPTGARARPEQSDAYPHSRQR